MTLINKNKKDKRTKNINKKSAALIVENSFELLNKNSSGK